MKNKVKKVCVCILALAIAMVCVGCTTKGICDECGQEATLTKYVLQGGMGNSGSAGKIEYLCDDCIQKAKFFGY